MNSDLRGAVLTDGAILDAVAAGDIVITPFDAARINSGSYDVTLGARAAVYAPWVKSHELEHGPRGVCPSGRDFYPNPEILDIKEEPHIHTFEMDPDRGFLLRPGIGYLMHTEEVVRSDRYIPFLDGKSSVGRLFIWVHVTAGRGDVGFDGQYTLEVVCMHPVRIYPGMRVGQMFFLTQHGALLRSYADRASHYKDKATSMGPVPSQLWKRYRT